ncbi:hypothetical protein DFH06DRAFT_999150 [Mycena polygramma]|nr:hypothetical protein DFH06DRAFT_999150 [Mycena polygramma]
MEDRTQIGCKNPHQCAYAAEQRFGLLTSKWNPRTPEEAQLEFPDQTEGTFRFQKPPQIKSLTDGFRVFTKNQGENAPAPQDQAPVGRGEAISFFIEARSTRNESGVVQFGGGAWYGPNNPNNTSVRLEGGEGQSTTRAELTTALICIRKAPTNSDLTICCSKNTLISTAVTNLQKWEDRGWIGVKDGDVRQALIATLKNRKGKTFLTENKAPSAKIGQAGASRLAREGARSQVAENLDLRVPQDQRLPGAKLSGLTQATAYAGIRATREKISRKATDNNVKQVQMAIRDEFRNQPTIAQIWKSIRHKDINRQIRNFLWKTLHSAHRIGKYWLNIPGFEDRATCGTCGEIEDMEHILLHCQKPGRAEIWELAEKLWRLKHPSWPSLSMGSIMGCALATFHDEKGRTLPGATRLYRILISESMYLIWKIRCDSVIGRAGELVPVPEIHNKWVSVINERLLFDRILTNETKYGKHASVSPSLVLQTWGKTLKSEESLPNDWLREPEVLVGVERYEPQRPPPVLPRRRGRNG